MFTSQIGDVAGPTNGGLPTFLAVKLQLWSSSKSKGSCALETTIVSILPPCAAYTPSKDRGMKPLPHGACKERETRWGRVARTTNILCRRFRRRTERSGVPATAVVTTAVRPFCSRVECDADSEKIETLQLRGFMS